MRLQDFILANVEPILQKWEDFARSLAPGKRMDVSALRDDAEAILRACARDMTTTQSLVEQRSKSHGHGGAGGVASERLDDASSVHGVGRVGSGFNLNEMVSEYRALRASVLALWRESAPRPDGNDIDDITRFNETIDQSLAKAVAAYTHRVDQSRRMFLAILSHDLRNPLNSISMSAQAASLRGQFDPESAQALSRIESSVQAISRLINDLLDFAATGLGEHMPLALAPVNSKFLGQEVVNELQAAHPGRSLKLNTQGDLICYCDGARMRQVLSNLLGNAVQHGEEGSDIELAMKTGESDILMAVHNHGTPIPPDLLPTIFDPLVRDTSAQAQLSRRAGSIGLGLYIAREIVLSHGGTIAVTSSVEAGTEFRIRVPRRPAGVSDSPSG